MSEMLSTECLQLRQRFDALGSAEPHLATCAACAAEYAAWCAMNDLLASVPPVAAPDDLFASVLAALPPKAAVSQAPRFDWLGGGAAAASVALVPLLLAHRLWPGGRMDVPAWDAVLPALLPHLPFASLGQAIAWSAVGLAVSHAFLQGTEQPLFSASIRGS